MVVFLLNKRYIHIWKLLQNSVSKFKKTENLIDVNELEESPKLSYIFVLRISWNSVIRPNQTLQADAPTAEVEVKYSPKQGIHSTNFLILYPSKSSVQGPSLFYSEIIKLCKLNTKLSRLLCIFAKVLVKFNLFLVGPGVQNFKCYFWTRIC